LNPQKPKECRIHARASPGSAPSDFFLFCYLKEKLRMIWFTTIDYPIFTLWQIVSEIPEMVLKKCSQTGSQSALGDEEGWQILHQIANSESNHLYHV
jgi:hypothetical protein